MKIYVGNLSFDVTEEELRQEFQSYGQVSSVEIIKDKFTSKPKGFAFIEMPTVSEAQAAITGLNGKMLKDRTLTVNPARPREDRNDRSRGYSKGGYGDRQRRY